MTGVYVQVALSYTGASADDHLIDLYDVGQALIGFQRSLALTTHLVLNGEVIVQAPSLRGASIMALPSEEGSWKQVAAIAIGSGIFTVGTAPTDTPLGHLVSSAYDYVVSETLGFHVDYESTLGKQYKQYKSQVDDVPELDQSRFDSLIEKCEPAITAMHRPIIESETAETAVLLLTRQNGVEVQIGPDLDRKSYDFIHETIESDSPTRLKGWVSSYNMNTYRGRIYLEDANRPIPFELARESRGSATQSKLADSLAENIRVPFHPDGEISVVAIKRTSRFGLLKSLLVLEVE